MNLVALILYFIYSYVIFLDSKTTVLQVLLVVLLHNIEDAWLLL